jgi:hypothetical protein
VLALPVMEDTTAEMLETTADVCPTTSGAADKMMLTLKQSLSIMAGN